MAGTLETKITLTAVDKVSATLKSIGQSFDRLKKSAQGISASFSKVGSAASDFGTRLRNVSLIATVAGGALFALTKSQAAYAEMLQITSQKTGISTQSLQKWQFIAKLNNLELSDMTVGLRGLSRTMAAAASDPKNDMAKWFKRNNIAIKDATGKLLPLEQVVGNISEVFKNAPDGPAKMATAMSLLGRAGLNMIPILNLGKDKIKELMEEAQKYGFILSNDMIKAQTEFDDSIDRTEWSISQLKMSIASKLIPIFQPMITRFREWLNVNRELIANNIVNTLMSIGDGFKIVGKVLYVVGSALAPVVELFGGLKTVIAAIVGVYLGGLVLSFARLVVALAGATKALWLFNMALLANPLVFIAAAIASVGYALYQLISTFEETKQAWIQLWGQVPQTVKDALRTAVAAVTFGMSEIAIAIFGNWESIKASFAKGGLSQVFEDMFKGAKDKIAEELSSLLPSFGSFALSVLGHLNPIIGLFNKIVGSINSIKSALGGGVSGSVNVNSNAAAGASSGGAPAPAAGAIGKTALSTTPQLNVASAQPQRTHLDVYMKIDSEGRPKNVNAKSDKGLDFAANTGVMV
jgi:hypothetical protein